ncbi:hypothetical protein EDC01DRAFT_725977 [Geopyxis carbonaria]|nr:hypothetical protein EDC01DRAFT_725977 [Geopyxis carbonaria]
MSTTATPPPPLFAPKHRKPTLRRRRSPSPAADASTTSPTTSPSPPLPSLLRSTRPRRRFGLTVSATPSTTTSSRTSASTSHATTAADAAADEVFAVVNRFTHQTGQILDVDKHMMAYVESRMSTRRQDPGASPVADSSGAGAGAGGEGGDAAPASKSSYWAPTRPEARGATLGKLHEVDLGEEAKQRNIALTAAALGPPTSTTTSTPTADTQNGGGRRRHNRRTSQDVERDRLVEEVLRETRLDLYTEEPPSEGDDGEGAADDKIAEKFRREFIDAIISKRRRKGGEVRGGAGTKGGKKEDKKRPKGPKLGGSRMARAQMREQQGAAATGAGVKK